VLTNKLYGGGNVADGTKIILNKTINELKYFMTVSVVVACVAACLFVSGCDETVVMVPKTDSRVFQCKSTQVSLVFGGDVMMARNVGTFIESSMGGDYGFLFEKILPEVSGADFAFVNLESVISDKGQALQTKIGPKFRADVKAVQGLLDSGIDMVSIANNHCFDYGRTAYEDSISRLRNNGILDTGGGFDSEEAYVPTVCTFNGPDGTELAKVAFIGFNGVGDSVWEAREEDTGLAWLTDVNLENGIKNARTMADVVVVSLHFGTEYDTALTDKEQVRLARLAVDLGADLVIGHHPHVVQPVVEYGGGYIAYSLGNLVFDQTEENNRNGILLKVAIGGKKVVSAETLPFRINNSYQPEWVE
jgi:poly-gamma-glutamate synthesis protein (capsule biosynthesis protein)